MAAESVRPLAILRGASVVYELEDTETQIGRGEDNDIVSACCGAGGGRGGWGGLMAWEI